MVMEKECLLAKELLLSSDYTVVAYSKEKVYTSNKRGVSPILEWYDNQIDLSGFCAADKVVGKGAAIIYVLLKIKAVYAIVLSEKAKSVLEANNIKVYYDTLVPNIINRKKDGMCPIETAVSNTDNVQKAIEIIRKTLLTLNT